MPAVPTTALPGGDELPAVGLGTWDLAGDQARESVRVGLEAGYGHVDTAEGYHNEAAVGEAVREYGRENVFLTSKVLPKHLHYESVIEACEASLDRLGVDALDLYLVHWPNPAISIRETMRAMERLVERGLVRNVGVSNFSRYQLATAQHVSDVTIAVNQIEYHPWFQRPGLVEYCQNEGVVVEAAAPLARTEVFEDEVVQELAAEYDRSPAQIVLRWAIEHDVVPLPKSGTADHVRANLDLFDWELAEDDVRALDDRDRNHPVYYEAARDWSGDVYGIPE